MVAEPSQARGSVAKSEQPAEPSERGTVFAGMALSDLNCLILYYRDKSNAKRPTSFKEVDAFTLTASNANFVDVACRVSPTKYDNAEASVW